VLHGALLLVMNNGENDEITLTFLISGLTVLLAACGRAN
jgi:hypothetical protein